MPSITIINRQYRGKEGRGVVTWKARPTDDSHVWLEMSWCWGYGMGGGKQGKKKGPGTGG